MRPASQEATTVNFNSAKKLMSSKRFLPERSTIPAIVLATILIFVPLAAAGSEGGQTTALLSPAPGSVVIAKRPDIIFFFPPSQSLENVVVLLDGIDMTGIVNAAPEGYVFRPVEMLAAGEHLLQIYLTAADGSVTEQQFVFSTRHSKAFTESYSQNNISVAYEKTIEEPDDAAYQTDYRVEVNLADETVFREKNWKMHFNTNLRYLDQDLVINPPLEKGFNLANYLLTGYFTGEGYQALAEFGDVNLNETQYTLNIARRGGTFAIDYETIKLKAFMVNSEEVFGFTGGTGLSNDTDDHLMGVSGEFGLFANKVRLKALYVTGGEIGNSYNIYNVNQNSKGDVLGFQATSTLVENKLTLEAELDYANYDPDTSDEFDEESDRAFRVAANGYWNIISYTALYEYIGTDYQVVGNPYLQGDREGYGANFGINHPVHAVTFGLSDYNDNVNKNPLYAQTNMFQGQVNYTYSRIANMPLGLNYQRSLLETSKEPANTAHYETVTDAITGTVNYLVNSWNFGFMAGFSEQDDKTDFNYDTDALNSTLSVSYLSQYITITPSLSYNRSRFWPTGVDTDTRTFTLDLRGNLWQQKLIYELAGTFSRMENSDKSLKQDSYNTNFRLAYVVTPQLWGMNYPSLGLMGTYYGIEDHLFDTSTDEFTLLFVFSTSIPFVL